MYFAMDVDDVPAAVGSRPDRLTTVSGPKERDVRHTVEHIVDSVSGLPVLNAPETDDIPVLGSVGQGSAARRGADYVRVEQGFVELIFTEIMRFSC